jgi:hypothetical protein
MFKVAEIDICEDCLTVVDGDPNMGDAESQARCKVAAEGLAQNWPGRNVHGACPEDCDGSFSWSACEGCGNTDGGNRHPAVVLGSYKITVFRVEYVPTDDGDRSVGREHETELTFDSAREIAEYLIKNGIDEPSRGPGFDRNVWWSDDPYEHPEGYTVEQSAHRDRATVPDGVWREVWLRITGTPTEVLMHLVTHSAGAVVPGPRVANRANPGDLPRLATAVIEALAGELDESDELRDVIAAHFQGDDDECE